MTDYTVGSMTIYKSTTRPRDRRLVGHLANHEYVAPPGRKWRNEGSDSEQEDLEVPEDSDSEKEEMERSQTGRSGTEARPDMEPVNVEEDEADEGAENFELRARKRNFEPEATSSTSKPVTKRRKFVLKPLASVQQRSVLAQPTPPLAQTQIPQETAPEATIPRHSDQADAGPSVAAANEAVTEQINFLNRMMLKMISDNQEQAELIKKQQETIDRLLTDSQDRERELQELKQSHQELKDSQQLMIMQREEERRSQEIRMKALEDSYTELQNNLITDDDGFLRFRDDIPETSNVDPPPAMLPGVPGASSSGTKK